MDVTGPLGLAIAAGVVLAASGFGLWRRHRDGRVRPVAATAGSEVLAALGFVRGAPVTLLQFSSAFCAPCRATRVICGQVAATDDRVRHLEVDAESRLEAVRALGVWRTPTVLIVASDGEVVARVIGQPSRQQLTEAVTPLLRQEIRS